jgi:predicted RNase H-like nuclease (RuvC/YqgF family)
VSTIEESIKDAKIAQLLEDHLLLEQHIKEMPEKIESSLSAVKIAIKELPENITASIETLVTALEEAEKSFTALEERHKGVLNYQLDEAKIDLRLALKNTINDALADSLRDANNQIAELSKKVANTTKNSRITSYGAWFLITILSGSTFLAVVSCWIIYLLYAK